MSGIFQTLLGSLAGVVKDTFFRYVTLLLPGNGTNGAQNNTFTDASTNNFSITRNGNTTQGTFSPYGSNWSNYFDGTGDYLTAPSNAAFAYGTGDFTWELWIYPIANTGYFLDHGSNGGTISFDGSTGRITYYNSTTATGSSLFTTGFVLNPTLNTWHHLAAVRSGGTTYLYFNGVLSTSAADSHNYGSQGVSIAQYGLGSNNCTAYISNLRLVKGTAVYTAGFTPPTSPLTAITNTSLLTCQSNRFIDNSTNAFTITRNGDVSVQRFSPFSPTDAYSASVIGGSGYFDGNGDFLNYTDASTLNFGTGSYTFEFWVYGPSNNDKFILGNNNTGTIQITTGGAGGTTVGALRYVAGGGLVASSGSTLITNDQWNHCAIVRNGSSSVTLYVNGVSVGTGTDSTNYTSTNSTVTIGKHNSLADNYLTGYISSLRILKGVAQYTANFTPPTSPLTAITNTSLLLNFTNAGIIDNAMLNDLETVGNAQISTAQSKFGGSSMLFDGTGDYLTAPSNAVYAFGTGDFTVEGWVYLGASKAQVIFDTRASGPSTTGIALAIDASNFPYVYVNGATLFTSSTALSLSTWTHLAFVKASGTITLYINGTKPTTGSAASATNLTDSACTVGTAIDFRDTSATLHFNGYIDDLRITKGVARYTANFTPPAAAFPTS